MRFLRNILLITFLTVIAGCREEYLSGDISGIVTPYDQYDYVSEDMSGAEVSIFLDSSLIISCQTDKSGRYIFNDLPYGKYTIDYRKQGFTRSYEIKTLNHLGGGVPLYSNLYIYEVPTFKIQLDSVRQGRYSNEKIIYLKIDGDTLRKSRTTSRFMVFASDSPDVTDKNFIASGKGYLTNRIDYSTEKRVAVKGLVSDLEDIGYKMAAHDSIYLVAYPLAGGQGYMFWQYLEGALGPRSNVIKCKWPK